MYLSIPPSRDTRTNRRLTAVIKAEPFTNPRRHLLDFFEGDGIERGCLSLTIKITPDVAIAVLRNEDDFSGRPRTVLSWINLVRRLLAKEDIIASPSTLHGADLLHEEWWYLV